MEAEADLRRMAPGGRWKRFWKTSLKRRTLPKPEESATSARGMVVSCRSCLAREHTASLCDGDGRGSEMLEEVTTELTLAQAEALCEAFDAGVFAIEGAPSAMRARARETVLEVPRQEARSGAVSGRQRRQGRYPASCAAWLHEP